MKLAYPFILLLFCVSCSAPAPRTESYPAPDYAQLGKIDGVQYLVTPMSGVEEGVYYLNAGYSKTVLELKRGRYRYWFVSDGKSGQEPTYPLTGKYLARRSTIQLLGHESDVEAVWTFRKIDGATTLWRPSALEAWHEAKGFDFYGVLYATNGSPEDVWKKSYLRIKP